MNMSDETYVDPNSGAAPQPGGYVGAQGASKGFAGAELGNVEEETAPAFYEAPGATSNNGSYTVPSEDVEKNDLQRALTEPKKVLAELGEEDVELPEQGSEAEANDNASVEHQGINPSEPEEGEEVEADYDPSEYGVEEVNAYLEENPDQRDAVVAAEKDGKNRKGITGE